MRRYLEAGRLNSPRGIKGELRFECWCDSPGFLEGVHTFYLDAEGTRPLHVALYRPSIPSLTFEGYEDRTRASQLVNRTKMCIRDRKHAASFGNIIQFL